MGRVGVGLERCSMKKGPKRVGGGFWEFDGGVCVEGNVAVDVLQDLHALCFDCVSST